MSVKWIIVTEENTSQLKDGQEVFVYFANHQMPGPKGGVATWKLQTTGGYFRAQYGGGLLPSHFALFNPPT